MAPTTPCMLGGADLQSIELTTPRAPPQSGRLAISRAWVLPHPDDPDLPSLTMPRTRAALQGEDATIRRDRAAATIEAFLEHFRRTGEFQSKLRNVGAAAADLLASASGILARGDKSNAAQSLIYVANIRRMQSQWDAALVAWGRRNAGAPDPRSRVAGQSAHRGPRREQQTRLRRSARPCSRGGPDDGRAPRQRSYGRIPSRSWLRSELKLGDFSRKRRRGQRRLTAAQESSALEVYYVLTGRADIWWTLASRCDTRPRYEPCLQQIDKARQDYAEARASAAGQGWDGLVGYTDEFLGQAEVLRSLYAQQNKTNTAAAASGLFKPKAPKDVLATETLRQLPQPKPLRSARPIYE